MEKKLSLARAEHESAKKQRMKLFDAGFREIATHFKDIFRELS
jgi:chromosome segregation ATPase